LSSSLAPCLNSCELLNRVPFTELGILTHPDFGVLNGIATTPFSDNIPEYATSAFGKIELTNSRILDDSGNVVKSELGFLYRRLGGIIGSISNTDLERSQEKQYKDKLGPRNVFLARPFVQRLEIGFMPRPIMMDLPGIEEAFAYASRNLGFGKSFVSLPIPMRYINPPKENANSGINLCRMNGLMRINALFFPTKERCGLH
jgi:hypothetical protein